MLGLYIAVFLLRFFVLKIMKIEEMLALINNFLGKTEKKHKFMFIWKTPKEEIDLWSH